MSASPALREVRRDADVVTARVDPAWIEARCDGHFPGDALVPGAYLLEAMVAVAGLVRGDTDGSRVARCAFRRPVRPGTAVEITARRRGAAVAVELRQHGLVAAQAVVGEAC